MRGQQKKLPIIALDYTGWDGNWMNRQHILSCLGRRGWPVLYSNGARYYHHMDFSMPFGAAEKKDHVKIYKAGSLLPRNYKFPALDRLAIKAHCRDLKKKAGLKRGDDFITFCFHPDFYPYVEELAAPYVMFHIYDLYHKFSNGSERSPLTAQLMQTANLITAASEVVWDEVVNDPHISPNIVHNGVDFSLFESGRFHKGQAYDLIDKIPAPRAGYIGAINRKLDFTMLEKLARKFSAVQFVMIGHKREVSIREDKKYWSAYQRFCQFDNVHFVGTIKKEEIPECLNLLDVTLAPYIMDRSAWAFAGYPLKINEYLAAGKPVISASSPMMIKHFDHIVSNCQTIDEWEKALVDALAGQGKGTRKERIEFAKSNDWENRVDQLEKLMFAMLA